jgi:hypothetical protein
VEGIEATDIGNPTSVISNEFSKKWIPNKRGQEDVLRAPTSIYEILGGGAAGGGKTDLAILEPVVREWHEHPKYKDLLMRRLSTDLEKEIIPRQKEWYTSLGAVYNETKQFWLFPSGSRFQNGHAEKEDGVRKYDTAEYNRICWEEATHFTKFQYLYLSLSRCRSSSPDLPAIIRAYTNPGNIGHQFFKERFVDPCLTGRIILRDKITGTKRLYIPFRGLDNPHLLINDPGYLKRLEGLPEQEKRAKLYGDWSAYEGQVFSEFRILRLRDEPEYAVHVIPPFDIPLWWPRVLAIDWGWAAMTFAIWAAIAPNGRAYVYRTWAWTKTPINIWAPEIVNLSHKENLEEVIVCHSAGAHRTEPLTIRDQIYLAFGEKYSVRLGDRDRVGGKNLLHEYLRWQQRPKSIPSEVKYDPIIAANILRRFGEDKYNEYMLLFVTQPDEINLPKLQIFTHGPEGRENRELIDVIPACVPDETNPEDVKEFQGDDPYDAIRLVCRAVQHYVEQSATEQDRRAKLDQIYGKLQQTTESQTAFYREIERIDSEDTELYQVRRKSVLGNHRFSVRGR